MQALNHSPKAFYAFFSRVRPRALTAANRYDRLGQKFMRISEGDVLICDTVPHIAVLILAHFWYLIDLTLFIFFVIVTTRAFRNFLFSVLND